MVNRRNLPGALLRFAGAGVVAAVGLGMMLAGLGLFSSTDEVVVWSPKLMGFACAVALLAPVLVMLGLGTLLERDWGTVEIDTLSPEAYLEALAITYPPAWTCTRCRVVEARRGLGTCVYCDSGTHYYSLDTDEDLKMVLSALS